MFNNQGTGLLQRFNAIIQRDRAAASSPAAKAAAERADIQKFNVALGLQGERIPLLADQQGIDVLLGMIQNANKMPGVDAAQSLFMKNFDSTAVRSWSNFQSLLTEVGEQAIPGMTKGLGDLADAFHNAQAWLHQHKQLEMDMQHWVTSTVIETEKWFNDPVNKAQIRAFGGMIVDIGKKFSQAGPELKALGGAAALLGGAAAGAYQPVKDLAGLIGKMFGGYQKFLDDQARQHPSTPAERQHINDLMKKSPLQLRIEELERMFGWPGTNYSGDSLGGLGIGTPGSGPRRTPPINKPAST
jgi:hypothetical protein